MKKYEAVGRVVTRRAIVVVPCCCRMVKTSGSSDLVLVAQCVVVVVHQNALVQLEVTHIVVTLYISVLWRPVSKTSVQITVSTALLA